LLGRFEGYANRARELLCSPECPCNLNIPLEAAPGRKLREVDPRDEEWRGKAPGPDINPPQGDVEGRDLPPPPKPKAAAKPD